MGGEFERWWGGEEADRVACDGDQWSLAHAAWDAAVEAERERAIRIAEACAAERRNQLPDCRAAGGAVESLIGKLTEADRIAEAIRKGV
jgi:hypothetical protein